MTRRLAGLLLLLIAAGLLPLGGCARDGKKDARKPTSAIVSVAPALEQMVADYRDFTGRTEAVETQEVKARATGYLEESPFVEGQFVKEGQLLFLLDDRTYRADVARLKSEIVRIEATLANYSSQLNNARRMRVGDAISREEYDKIAAGKGEAAGSLDAAKAQAQKAELNLGFTKVRAMISGRISKANVTRGNLVTQDQTLLATIVKYDPIYAYFDIDEATVLRLQQMIREKKLASYRDAEVPVLIGTQIEKGHPHKGRIDYVDPALNPATGTLRVRGVFSNVDVVWPEGVFKKVNWGGLADDTPPPSYLLTPGLFIRVRLPLGQQAQPAILVRDSAIGSNQGRKYVYVVNEQNKVEERLVETGPLRDGLRAIERGLKAGERVIVDGIQRVRPGVTVEPNPVAMQP